MHAVASLACPHDGEALGTELCSFLGEYTVSQHLTVRWTHFESQNLMLWLE